MIHVDWWHVFFFFCGAAWGVPPAYSLGRRAGRVLYRKRRDAVIASIRFLGGDAYASELGDVLGVRGAWVSFVLRDLKDEGLIERVADDAIVPGTKSVRRVRWRVRTDAFAVSHE